MRRLLSAMLALTLLVTAFTSCGDDDDDDDVATEPSPLPSGAAAPPFTSTVDQGCVEAQPDKLFLDPTIAPFLTACASASPPAVRITNNSAAVFEIAETDLGRPSVVDWHEESGQNDFVDQAVRSAVTAGRRSASFVLVPRATVVATGFFQVHLTATMLAAESGASWASTYLAHWVQSRISPRSAVLQSLAGCAQAFANGLGPGVRWEDQLRNAFTGFADCQSVARFVNAAIDPGRVDQTVSEVAQVGRRSGPIWDDLARLAGRVATIFSKT